MLELNNPKVIVRPSQAESIKGKNVVIGDEKREKKLTQKIPQGEKHSGGKTRRRRPTTSRPVWPATAAVWPVRPVWSVVGPVWPVRPINLGTPPKSRQGRVLRNSWPNMRSKALLRRWRSNQMEPSIRNHHWNIKSNQFLVHTKVIMLLRIMGRLLLCLSLLLYAHRL